LPKLDPHSGLVFRQTVKQSTCNEFGGHCFPDLEWSESQPLVI
jgi:hypothetical protein